MCGRYSLFTPINQVAEKLKAKAAPFPDWSPRYNAAPSQYMPVITNEFPDVIQWFRWGLVPKWAKDKNAGPPWINTRTESIREKPAFRNIFRYHRCIIPADGYYEWKVMGTGTKKIPKQPYRFCLPHDDILLLAGIWDSWQGEFQSFSIITCAAGPEVAAIHDRMPVILDEASVGIWLSGETDAEKLLPLLKPPPEHRLMVYPISTLVNAPAHDNADIIEPLPT